MTPLRFRFVARAPACLSDLRLDMWLAHDLPPADEENARAHVEGCAACAARLAQIQTARAANDDGGAQGLEALRRAAAAVAAAAPARARRRPWFSSWPSFTAALAGAGAVAAVVAAIMANVIDPDAGGSRTKGGGRVGFFVKHDDRVRRGGPDEVVSPGDLVRFTYTIAEPLYLAVIGTDAARRATIYFPADHEMRAVAAGQDVELPRSTLLDDTLGTEVVYALFCARPIELEPVRRALEQDAHQPPSAPDCRVDRLTWIKVDAR